MYKGYNQAKAPVSSDATYYLAAPRVEQLDYSRAHWLVVQLSAVMWEPITLFYQLQTVTFHFCGIMAFVLIVARFWAICIFSSSNCENPLFVVCINIVRLVKA